MTEFIFPRSIPLACVLALAVLVVIGLTLPDWAMFLATMAFSKGMVALGVVCLMRFGLVSFGQGLYYCLGAYASGLMASWIGTSDIFLLSLLGIIASGLVAAVFGPLLATYRGIFFAMLTLSLSMILYGTLSKMSVLGGTDGLNVSAPTFLGYQPEGRALGLSLYMFTCAVIVVYGGFVRTLFDSERGLISLAIRDNELRVEYLGASVRTEIAVIYIVAAIAGGIGGVISGAAIGHVDPEYAYWTTSGEFVFVAILSGYFSIPAVFLGSVVLEIVRSFSNLYFPNTWQMSLGIFLLIVILLFPKGLGSLLARSKKPEKMK
jgi:branched-chain amino acid transport system permease protein